MVLAPADVERLGAAGLSDDEIAAVDASITNSLVLAVKSFVDEVDDGAKVHMGRCVVVISAQNPAGAAVV